jgi:prepilin-type N-terminal cleavage/methylation domain-containing protein
MEERQRGFTLVEMLVAIAVLTLLVLLITRLVNSAALLTTLATKRMDVESDARPLFDRMGVDFAQMVKRSDVSYYLKNQADTEPGNDQLAFYSTVAGYYPSSSKQSPFSLISYRVNSDSSATTYNKLERMGKGLIWNGTSPSFIPILFNAPSATAPTTTINNMWPAATSTSTADSDYEPIAPQVFRLEYYYLLNDGTLSVGPWSSGTTIDIKNVAAIAVAIATIDSRSKVLLTNAQIATIATSLVDYDQSMGPGQLLSQWQSTLDSTTGLPRPAISNIRLYERYFYVSSRP